MNDQLRTLVRQAVVAVDIVTGNEALDDELAKMYIPDCFAEKFAELIVGECMACSSWVGKMNTTAVEPVHTAHAINQRIKEHFGVAEREE